MKKETRKYFGLRTFCSVKKKLIKIVGNKFRSRHLINELTNRCGSSDVVFTATVDFYCSFGFPHPIQHLWGNSWETHSFASLLSQVTFVDYS